MKIRMMPSVLVSIIALCSFSSAQAALVSSSEVHFNVELKSRTGKKEQISKAFFKVKNNSEFAIQQERTGLRIVFIPKMLKVLTGGAVKAQERNADMELDAKVFKKIRGRFELISDSQLRVVMNRPLIFYSMSEKKNEFFELELTGRIPN